MQTVTDTDTSVLSTTALSIGYRQNGRTAVICRDLNLVLCRKQFVCLLGANGAGKSTLLRTLSSVQPPLGGSIRIQQQDIRKISRAALAHMISLVLTDPVQTGNLSVYTLLTLGRYPYAGWLGILNNADRGIIRQAAETAGITAFLDKNMHELSDGERQKVMIARALVQDTPLIILDEPTAHLDLPNRVAIVRLLRSLVRHTGKSVLLSTHELDLALQAADTVWLMMPNQSMLCGAPEDLILNGTFEDAFRREGFDFDRATGTFNVHKADAYKTIEVHGDQQEVFWTTRALQREGYTITGTAACSVRAYACNNVSCWELRRNGAITTFKTVAALLTHLRHHTN
jgi:iron complex transport system ATP-binding protein